MDGSCLAWQLQARGLTPARDFSGNGGGSWCRETEGGETLTGAKTLHGATSHVGCSVARFKIGDPFLEVAQFLRHATKLSEQVCRVFPAKDGISVKGVWMFGHRGVL